MARQPTGLRWEPLIKATFDVKERFGDEFIAPCPWHGDTGRPNLWINGRKGVYICYSCGKGGKLGVEFASSGLVPRGVDLAGMKERLQAIGEDPEQIPHLPDEWLSQFDHYTPYWKKRGLAKKTIKRWELGYDPMRDHQVIPVRDYVGRLNGVIRRTQGKPRYLDPTGVPKGQNLFGAHLLSTGERVALVEGPIDAIKCDQAGVPAVALMGSRLTRHQARLLRMMNIRSVVMMLDNDKAGREGTDAVIADIPHGVVVYECDWASVVDEWCDRHPADEGVPKDAGDLDDDLVDILWSSAVRS